MNNKINNLLSDPQINGWGFLVGVIGFIFAVYTYFDSQSYPDLIAQVHPNKTVLVSEQGMQEVTVYEKGRKVEGPITSVQIAIWNNGKKEIRAQDVLEKLVISTNEKAEILSAKVIKQSRKVINLKVSIDEQNKGSINIDFSIFEHGDAALIQIIYVGKDDIDFIAAGSLIGQNHFYLKKFSSALLKENARSENKNKTTYFTEKVIFVFSFIFMAYYFIRFIPGMFYRTKNLFLLLKPQNRSSFKWLEVMDYLLGLLIFLVIISGLYISIHILTEVKSPYLYG